MGKTYQSLSIDAPLNKVWDKIKNFHDLSWAPNVITKVEPVGNVPSYASGSKRILNDAFHETLIEIDEENNFFKYSIDDGPSPISAGEINNYIGHVNLTPISLEDKTFIEWSSSWENNDEAAGEFCHTIYVALLNELKNSFS